MIWYTNISNDLATFSLKFLFIQLKTTTMLVLTKDNWTANFTMIIVLCCLLQVVCTRGVVHKWLKIL